MSISNQQHNNAMELKEWLIAERQKLGAVDGYDYQSGVEHGLTLAQEQVEKLLRPSCCAHDSDCAVHNVPAYLPGPCDCKIATERTTQYAQPGGEVLK